jgi:hypothetical protein
MTMGGGKTNGSHATALARIGFHAFLRMPELEAFAGVPHLEALARKMGNRYVLRAGGLRREAAAEAGEKGSGGRA